MSNTKRSRWPVAAVLAAAALAVLAWCLRGAPPSFPRLRVAGFSITQEEYLRAMHQARNQVLSDHAAAGISLTDWSAETPLGDPCELTAQGALDILTEYYAVSTLAVERGYLSDASYKAMLADLDAVNRKRQEALDTGGIVTGIPLFSTDDYITYRSLNIKLQFCDDPNNPEYQVTQEDIRQRYEADRDDLYRQPDAMELAFLLADGADDALESDFQRALEIGELTAALEEMPHLKPYFQQISVTPATYGIYARSHGDVLAWAAALPSGGLSQLIRQEDRLCLIQCFSRTAHQYAPLEEVESLVVQSIRESRYDDLVAQRMAQLPVEGDLGALRRFTAGQLP